jgi:hypothetical protein
MLSSSVPSVGRPLSLTPKRQSANAEPEAVQSSQIWPPRHSPREAPARAQRRDLKVAEPRWSATAVQAPVLTGALTRSDEESKPARLAEAPKLCRRTVGIWRKGDVGDPPSASNS